MTIYPELVPESRGNFP